MKQASIGSDTNIGCEQLFEQRMANDMALCLSVPFVLEFCEHRLPVEVDYCLQQRKIRRHHQCAVFIEKR